MRNINDLVKNITEGTRAAHAFIIEGRSERGRSVFITSLAAGLECTSPDIGRRPCGSCPACRQAAAGTSMDIVRMSKSAGTGRSGRETYRVDDAAAFIERLSMGAYGRYLIGIIDDADMLSETIQNKLLKTLEEPAANTLILLGAANRDNLLSTVRSRCSDIRMADYVQDNGIDDDAAREEEKAAAEKSSALHRLADTTVSSTAFFEFRASADKYLKTKEDALDFLDILEEDLRDWMIRGGEKSPADYARDIELLKICRMDIRREMNHSRAVRRLFLEMDNNR